jgi:MFS family permease
LIFARSVPRKAQRAYTWDAWAGILVGLYTGSIFPFYLVIAREKLGANAFQIGVMIAAPFLGNWFALFWANAMEGRSKMPFAVASWVLARSFFLLMVIAVTPWRFALLVAMGQFLVTVASPAYASIMKDIYPDAHRGRIMAYVRVFLAFSQITATFIVGYLLKGGTGTLPLLWSHAHWHLSPISYRWIFPVGATFGIASALMFSRIRTSGPSLHEQANKGNVFQFMSSALHILVEDKGFRWFAFSVFAYGFGSLIVAPVYPMFQVDRLHISYGQVAVLTNVMNIVWMLSFVYWGRYVDARSPLRATVINVSLAMLCPLNYFFAALLPHPTVWLLLPSALLFGFTNAGIELAYFNSVLRFSGEHRVSHYQALFSWLLGLRGSVAPFIGGALTDAFTRRHWDIRYIFILAAMIMFLGAVMQFIGLRRDEVSS